MGPRVRYFRNLVVGVPAGVNTLCALSVGALFLKVFWLNQVPAAFPGAYESGVLVDAILTSVVASYIFYLLTSRLPEFERQRVFAPYVATKCNQARGSCESLLGYIGKNAGRELHAEGLDKESLRSCLAKIVPTSDAPLIVGNRYATWLELIRHECMRARSNAHDLQEKSPFLDVNVALLAGRVVEAPVFDQLDLMMRQPLRVKGSEFLTTVLYAFIEDCCLLRRAGLRFAAPYMQPELAEASTPRGEGGPASAESA